MDNNSIIDLKYDMVRCVFDHLDFKNKCRLALTSKYFYSIFLDTLKGSDDVLVMYGITFYPCYYQNHRMYSVYVYLSKLQDLSKAFYVLITKNKSIKLKTRNRSIPFDGMLFNDISISSMIEFMIDSSRRPLTMKFTKLCIHVCIHQLGSNHITYDNVYIGSQSFDISKLGNISKYGINYLKINEVELINCDYGDLGSIKHLYIIHISSGDIIKACKNLEILKLLSFTPTAFSSINSAIKSNKSIKTVRFYGSVDEFVITFRGCNLDTIIWNYNNDFESWKPQDDDGTILTVKNLIIKSFEPDLMTENELRMISEHIKYDELIIRERTKIYY